MTAFRIQLKLHMRQIAQMHICDIRIQQPVGEGQKASRYQQIAKQFRIILAGLIKVMRMRYLL
jgi:hypothetical protein